MKKVFYEAVSEFGTKRFFKHSRFMDFMWIYIPKWAHKIRPYKVKNGIRYLGQYRKDNRFPIKF